MVQVLLKPMPGMNCNMWPLLLEVAGSRERSQVVSMPILFCAMRTLRIVTMHAAGLEETEKSNQVAPILLTTCVFSFYDYGMNERGMSQESCSV